MEVTNGIMTSSRMPDSNVFPVPASASMLNTLLALSFIALLTNPAILCFTSHRIARGSASPQRRLLLFAAIVHALLLLKLLVYLCTPAAPAAAAPPAAAPAAARGEEEGEEGEEAPADSEQ